MYKRLDFVKSEEFGVGIITEIKTKVRLTQKFPHNDTLLRMITVQYPVHNKTEYYAELADAGFEIFAFEKVGNEDYIKEVKLYNY